MSKGSEKIPTYAGVYFFIIVHFKEVHVIYHQSLPHGEFTLRQCGQHPLILREPEHDIRRCYDFNEINHKSIQILVVDLTYPSSGVPGELHHLVKVFRSKLIRRSSPAPSPSIRSRFRITSSKTEAEFVTQIVFRYSAANCWLA